MHDFLIKEYIERMNKDDVVNFAKSQGITLNDNEAGIIHVYLKKHWRTFYYGNPKDLLEDLKGKINPETYSKIELLYVQTKNKLN